MAPESVELVHEGDIDFSKPLPRALLRDGRLSWGARGLFAFLWDLPIGWRFRISHLTKMGPDGRDATRSRLRELEAVKAVRIEAVRGPQGKLGGKRWILRSPLLWARETPLAPLRGDEVTEERVFRSSANPKAGKPATKVHQHHGSPKTTTQQDDFEHIVEAACWAARIQNAEPSKPAAWRRAIHRRLERNGPNADDLATLAEWRKALADEALRKAQTGLNPTEGIVVPEGDELIGVWQAFLAWPENVVKNPPPTYEEATARERAAFVGFLAARAPRLSAGSRSV